VSTPTQLKTYNAALNLCGSRRITSLSVDEEARHVLDDVWDRGHVDRCLAKGMWKFALRTSQIDYDTSYTDPLESGWYRFDVPSDHIRTVQFSQNGSFTDPDLGYQKEGAYWYSTLQIIYVRYVSNGASYGADYSLWPEDFQQFVEADLALQCIKRLTDAKADYEDLARVRNRLLLEAKSTSAMEDPTRFPPETSWNASRRGFRGYRSNRDYGGM
jgi:hypothetical protein